MIAGGSVGGLFGIVSILYSDNLETWNTGCIFQCLGSLSLYVRSEYLVSISNGPSHLGVSLGDLFGIRIFVVSSQTCCPTSKGASQVLQFCCRHMSSALTL